MIRTWNLYCVTEQSFIIVRTATEPIRCPNNPAHTITLEYGNDSGQVLVSASKCVYSSNPNRDSTGNVVIGNGNGPLAASKSAPNGEFVGTTDVQTLTNKTLTDITNNIAARSLVTSDGVVDVGSAAAPTAGQTLIATSATLATWQTQPSVPSVMYVSAVNSIDTTVIEPSIVPGLTIAPAVVGKYIVWFEGVISLTPPIATGTISIYSNGVLVSGSTRVFAAAGSVSIIGHIPSWTEGAITIQWGVSKLGTITMVGRSMTVMRVI